MYAGNIVHTSIVQKQTADPSWTANEEMYWMRSSAEKKIEGKELFKEGHL